MGRKQMDQIQPSEVGKPWEALQNELSELDSGKSRLTNQGEAFPHGLRWAAVFAASGLLGCQGQIVVPEDEKGSAPSQTGRTEPPASQGSAGELPAANGAEPGPASLKKLRTWELRQTMATLLGVPAATEVQLRDDLVRASFSSVSAGADCYDAVAIENREQMTLELAAHAFSRSPTPLDAAGCLPQSASDPCLRGFVESFGRRAWRRSLSNDEIDKYLALLNQVASLYQGDLIRGAELTSVAILSSPYFLYRVELGEPVEGRDRLRKYTSTEMASRLSFSLWGQGPSEDLIAEGEAGNLSTAEQLRSTAAAMIEDPRARPELERFWREHLSIDRLTIDNYPKEGASEALYRSMRQEMLSLVDELVEPGADALHFLTADRTLIDPRMAEHYGLSSNEPTAQRSLPASRLGYLTSGLFLTSTSHPDKNSPVRRGIFVLERILCGQVLPPTTEVMFDIPEAEEGEATLREQLSEHLTNDACRACHFEIDPLGFAFENFDRFGVQRSIDNGLPVDSTGAFRGFEFEDARELIDVIVQDPDVSRCLVVQGRRFLTGLIESSRRDAGIDTITQTFEASGRDYRALVAEIVASDTFRFASGFVGD